MDSKLLCSRPCLDSPRFQDNYVNVARIREYKENLLRKVELLAQMTDEQIGKLAAIIKKEKYTEGDIIIKQYDPGTALYMIESGEASTHPPPPWLPTTHVYKKGHIFGEANLLETAPSDATVTASSRSSCFPRRQCPDNAHVAPPLPPVESHCHAATTISTANTAVSFQS